VFQDRAKIFVEGGRGGDGVVSFRREAHVPKGGPDGGDGGHGGDVVLVCDPSLRDLARFGRRRHFRAGRGRHGKGKQQHGARGAEELIPVPPGTGLEGLDGERSELLEPGQRLIVARGGSGGHGNKRFATSTRQAPRFAENGTAGQQGWIELHLRLLADAGLIGLPNAGKSSLLARLTRAAPKVGDYPFTTLEPVLGTLEGADRQAVLADIPGLIEGAAGGAGLGHDFLAHVERCQVLLHLVEVAPASGDPVANYETVRAELRSYGAGLEGLPELVVLSKSDLLVPEELEALVALWRERSGEGAGVLAVSSATGAGLEELRRRTLELIAATPAGVAEEPAARGFETEHRTYRPADEDGYWVEREGDGAYRVHGRGVAVLFERHDTNNEEALAYLEQRLAEMGVLAALQREGFEPGDDVRIGEHEFELHPAR